MMVCSTYYRMVGNACMNKLSTENDFNHYLLKNDVSLVKRDPPLYKPLESTSDARPKCSKYSVAPLIQPTVRHYRDRRAPYRCNWIRSWQPTCFALDNALPLLSAGRSGRTFRHKGVAVRGLLEFGIRARKFHVAEEKLVTCIF